MKASSMIYADPSQPPRVPSQCLEGSIKLITPCICTILSCQYSPSHSRHFYVTRIFKPGCDFSVRMERTRRTASVKRQSLDLEARCNLIRSSTKAVSQPEKANPTPSQYPATSLQKKPTYMHEASSTRKSLHKSLSLR